jgi:hypothetical protein
MAASLIVVASLAGCAKAPPPIPEAQYSTKIVGRWSGTVGDEREIMSINADGTFDCKISQRGFIANTLSEGVTGSVNGTWRIAGKTVTLMVNDAKNEQVTHVTTLSQIVSFSDNKIVLKSDRGGTAPFYRIK